MTSLDDNYRPLSDRLLELYRSVSSPCLGAEAQPRLCSGCASKGVHTMPEAKPIAVLQKYLGYLGFEISDVSGTLGQSTVAALKRFQKEHGLKVTGEIDDPTALGIWLEAVVVRTMVDIDLQKCLPRPTGAIPGHG